MSKEENYIWRQIASLTDKRDDMYRVANNMSNRLTPYGADRELKDELFELLIKGIMEDEYVEHFFDRIEAFYNKHNNQ